MKPVLFAAVISLFAAGCSHQEDRTAAEERELPSDPATVDMGPAEERTIGPSRIPGEDEPTDREPTPAE